MSYFLSIFQNNVDIIEEKIKASTNIKNLFKKKNMLILQMVDGSCFLPSKILTFQSITSFFPNRSNLTLNKEINVIYFWRASGPNCRLKRTINNTSGSAPLHLAKEMTLTPLVISVITISLIKKEPSFKSLIVRHFMMAAATDCAAVCMFSAQFYVHQSINCPNLDRLGPSWQFFFMKDGCQIL